MAKKKKSKGPSQMVPYAVRMQHANSALTNEERKDIVHQCRIVFCQAAATALSEEFGFGAKREARFRARLDSVLLELGVLDYKTDTDYAMGVLERRYKQIMDEGGADL